MDKITEFARAKINLTLDVLRKRSDGYHDLRTVMQTVTLCDEIELSKRQTAGIQVCSDAPDLPDNEENLAYKGAKQMTDAFAQIGGVSIKIKKRIPIAAGLAGGSADCAAVMRGMNILFDLGLSLSQLQQMGAALGADVPYCLLQATALAEGVGDRLTRLSNCPHFFIVLVKPNVSISTAYVYQHLQLDRLETHPNTEKMIQAVRDGDKRGIAKGLCNVLETVTIPLCTEIAGLKKQLLTSGALGALMSGSGPTVFGIFENKQMAEQAARQMAEKWNGTEVLVTETYCENEGEKSHYDGL